jgi:bifunctional DNase/RNase
MKRKEVKILGLSYSQTQVGSYVVVLSEIKGNKKLPVIIKPLDAQQIALKIEGMKSPRPLTHDLFKTMTDSFSIDIQEVYIHAILEGIFYTKLISSNGIDSVEIECSAGDGIALAIVYKCPIYVSKSVMDASGILINDDGTALPSGESDVFDDASLIDDKKKRVVSVEDLQHMMEDALANEEYEIAAEIRDKIKNIQEKNETK